MSKPVYIEYLGGKPHSVIDEDGNEYDFEYCKAHDVLLYREAGGHNLKEPLRVFHTVYWAAPSVCIQEDDTYGKSKRLKYPRRKYPVSRLFDNAWNVEYEGWAWCSKCEDWLIGNDLCEHVDYCDECGMYSTPDEPCEHAPNVVRF